MLFELLSCYRRKDLSSLIHGAFVALLAAAVPPSLAATYHATPAGSGSQDGSSWNHAVSASELNTFLAARLKPGDLVRLGAGTFRHPIVVTVSGTDSAPIRIEGITSASAWPIVEGAWDASAPAEARGPASGIELRGSYIQVRHLTAQRWMNGVLLPEGSDNRGIVLENLAIDTVREGVRAAGFRESTLRGLTLRRYTKRGIRFNGNCYDLLVQRCVADHNGGDTSWPSEWPFGFMIEEKENQHDITFRECRSSNNAQPLASHQYWNGDGFCAERTAYNIRYIGCEAYNNTDGGWDDKSRGASLEHCVAWNNKRNFRLWNANGTDATPANLVNCIGGYAKKQGGTGSPAGLWLSGPAKVIRSTFHNNGADGVAIATEGRTGGYLVEVCDSILSNTQRAPLLQTGGGVTVRLIDTVQYVAAQQGSDPRYISDRSDWRNVPVDAFNSQSFGPSRGYWAGSSPSASSIPGRIEAEQFNAGGEGVDYHDRDAMNRGGAYRMEEGVDIELCSRPGPSPNYNVGWIDPGEWLQYTVQVAEAGSYDLELYVARAPTGMSGVRVRLGSGETLANLAVPSTGGWQTWTTLRSRVTLPAGRVPLRLEATGNFFNIDAFMVTKP